jgi:hypothetical protein
MAHVRVHVGCTGLRVGELLDGRYRVSSTMGKGVFSTVCRAIDVSGGDPTAAATAPAGTANGGGTEVAIKIIRANETMYKAGLKEASILRILNAADARDKRHVIRLHRQFEHRGHLCLVFESLRCAPSKRACVSLSLCSPECPIGACGWLGAWFGVWCGVERSGAHVYVRCCRCVKRWPVRCRCLVLT